MARQLLQQQQQQDGLRQQRFQLYSGVVIEQVSENALPRARAQRESQPARRLVDTTFSPAQLRAALVRAPSNQGAEDGFQPFKLQRQNGAVVRS